MKKCRPAALVPFSDGGTLEIKDALKHVSHVELFAPSSTYRFRVSEQTSEVECSEQARV
jgi:hypothetical protein